MEHERLVDSYLGRDWKKTRQMLTWLFVSFSKNTDLLRQLHQVKHFDQKQEKALSNAVMHIINQIMTYPLEAQDMTAHHRAIWDAALYVYPDYRVLVNKIMKDKGVRALKDAAKPEGALWILFQHHLNDLCYKAKGFSSDDARVWPTLLKFSNNIIQKYNDDGRPPPRGYRCSTEHFIEIHQKIASTASSDKRVNKMDVDKIGEYFGWFCPECRHLVSLDEASLSCDDRGDDEIETDLPPSARKKALVALRRLLPRLAEPKKAIIYAVYFGRGNLMTLRQSFGEEEFKRLQDDALCELRELLAKSVTSWKSETKR
ncbi:MAG TPA: hypothetical protein VKC66_30380 [Xanthobacteraceae bacterium]|nr:hypothetical protein [Xanthobacteraceae bacterium]